MTIEIIHSDQDTPLSLFLNLSEDVRHRWSTADAVIDSGSDTGYLQAAEQLRGLIADIAAFERVNGATTEVDELRIITTHRLEALIKACGAENEGYRNEGYRKQRAREVPCPTQR